MIAVIRSYRDLQIWQRAMMLAANVYRLAANMPGNERFGQIQRAAVLEIQLLLVAAELGCMMNGLRSKLLLRLEPSTLASGP